ncbi:MAG TPA: MFS transporter, partial [Microlunatus sp.]
MTRASSTLPEPDSSESTPSTTPYNPPAEAGHHPIELQADPNPPEPGFAEPGSSVAQVDDGADPSGRPRRLPRLGSPGRTFAALGVRNYRIYFTGALLSNVGTWMQRVAQDWLVLELSGGSGLAVGITTALQFLPMLLITPYGGVIADRFDKR